MSLTNKLYNNKIKMSNYLGKLFLLIGPSGVGKGTLIEELKKRHSNWVFPISVTTRKKRPGEINGKTYYFFTKKQFEKAKENGEFLEYALVHNKEFYGLLAETVFTALKKGKIIFREIDIQGFESIQKKIFKNNLVSIFLLPPNLEVLKERIKSRSPLSDEEVKRRLESANNEIKKSKKCNHKVQTEDGEIEKAVLEIEKIIKQEMKNSAKL